MNSDKLSKRLETVVKYITNGSRLADIGSDHAYLPCNVVKKGLVPFAIAGEVVEGPFQSARKEVLSEGLHDTIDVRKGDGLAVIERGEVDIITICGMGGSLIANILEAGKEKLSGVKRLILQPNIGAVSVRKWFLENGWELLHEEILEEDGKIYEVLVAEQGEPLKPYQGVPLDMALLLGPFLMDEKNEAFRKKWSSELSNWQRILRQLEKGQRPENESKKQELLEKIRWVEGVLQE